ncbi:MAG TPA: YetF domain-containing protein [Sphingomicrobium sp.]|jgi:uncharacterized membrane protein YcaP (DUF421 family)|nr:YetF domain-containing protein [Sphingomicrobium sp.]
MDWIDIFYRSIGEAGVDPGWAQLSVRALIIFTYGLVATRVGAWRAFGRWSSPDIIVAIIIGANLSRALTANAPMVPTIVATTVFIAAYWLVSFAASRSDRLDRLLKGVPVPLIRSGMVDEAAMHRAVLSRRDLDEALRQKGVARDSLVAAALLERNGSITVIRDEDVK